MQSFQKKVFIWHRKNQELIKERVPVGNVLRWLYEKAPKWFCACVTGHFLSWVVGKCAECFWSRFWVRFFQKRYEIDLDAFEKGPFPHFQAFFQRKFLPCKRSFVQKKQFPAFVEGRFFVFKEVKETQPLSIKGQRVSLRGILGSMWVPECFQGGSIWIGRLAPQDYHGFHYPDDGILQKTFRIHGALDSVHPFIFDKKPQVWMYNERKISLLETRYFGKILYIEIGALFIGSIVQTFPEWEPFHRGDRKGVFGFGGSTVFLWTERGRVQPDQDLLDWTQKGIETFVSLGEKIGILC